MFLIKNWLRLFLVFLLLSVIPFSCPSAKENLPEVIKKVQGSIVLITTYNEKGDLLGQGSGFFITKNGDVITCRHVLKGAIKGEVQTTDGRKYAVKEIVAEDKEVDLIRFSIDLQKDTVEPLSLSISAPLPGERVAVIGSPWGLEATVSDGIVSAVRDVQGFGKIIQMTVPISPGSSGSPVINLKGEVVGIVSFYLTEGQNLNFAVSSERMGRLLPSKNKDFAQWVTSENQESEKSAEDLCSKGLPFVFKKDYTNALPFFERAVEIKPDFAGAYFCLGYIYDKLGRYQEAINAYKQAFRLEPNVKNGLYGLQLSLHFFIFGDNQDSVDLYKQVVRFKPDDAEAHYSLGSAYDKFGHYQEAIDAYKQAIRIKPDYASAYISLGFAYDKLGRYREAIDAYKQAIRIKSDDAWVHYSLGSAYGNLGRYREAIDAFKQAIRLKPDDADMHLNLGVSYGSLGRLDRRQEAIDAYKQAIRIKPDYALAHYNLGLSYLYLNNKGSALEEYKILKSLDSELAEELFNTIYK